MEDEAIGPLLAGRLYGRASKLALNLRVPRPHGGWDVGDAALIRLAVEEVRDPNDPNVVLQAYIPSGVQYLMNSLRQAFGMLDQDLAAQSLDRFFGFHRGKLSLNEYAVEFDSRLDEAADRAGLQLNEVGKFWLFFRNSDLAAKTIDDIKLQVGGDFTRFNDARTLALRMSPNRASDEAEIFHAKTPHENYYQSFDDESYYDDGWNSWSSWYGYENEYDEGNGSGMRARTGIRMAGTMQVKMNGGMMMDKKNMSLRRKVHQMQLQNNNRTMSNLQRTSMVEKETAVLPAAASGIMLMNVR